MVDIRIDGVEALNARLAAATDAVIARLRSFMPGATNALAARVRQSIADSLHDALVPNVTAMVQDSGDAITGVVTVTPPDASAPDALAVRGAAAAYRARLQDGPDLAQTIDPIARLSAQSALDAFAAPFQDGIRAAVQGALSLNG